MTEIEDKIESQTVLEIGGKKTLLIYDIGKDEMRTATQDDLDMLISIARTHGQLLATLRKITNIELPLETRAALITAVYNVACGV